jgi:ferredoxin-type protein NapG
LSFGEHVTVTMTERKRGDGPLDAESKQPIVTRRGFLAGVGGLVAMVGLGGVVKVFSGGDLLRPPGGQDEASFIARCVKCDRCTSICPTRVIGIAEVEDGFANARTPIMKFHLGECTFCGKCTEVCPTKALEPYRTTSARFKGETVLVPDVTIGLATVQKDRCIAWNRGTCAVCSRACPYGALTRDANGRPVVHKDACNGCGICEHVCPALTARSYMGGTVRGIVVKPVERGGAL